jgi:hypothetical protein
MPQRVIDVVLHTADWDDRMSSSPPLSREVSLAGDVSVSPIFPSVSAAVFDLCNPHRFRTAPIGRPKVQYAFVRGMHLEDDANSYAFDHDGRLNTALALSRLVRPTAIGFENSARLILDEGGEIIEALPGHIKGMAAFAYVAGISPHNWLTKSDAVETGKLLAMFLASEGTRPPRVSRALWRHEYAARSEYLDLRWLFVASGLESLVKIKYPHNPGGKSKKVPGSTAQFKKRTAKLALRYAASGMNWTEPDAETAYDLRSDVAHGLSITKQSPHLPLYLRMETLLRYALVEALTVPSFATTFLTDSSIETAWPV